MPMRSSLVLAMSSLALAIAPGAAGSDDRHLPAGGINLATGSFAPEKVPGRYGIDYVYPDRPTAAPFLAAGMTTVRVPVIWERLQPRALGALDDAEMARLDASLREMSGFRQVIVDIHNYGAFGGRHVTDTPALTAAFADLWRKLAIRYRDRPAIVFGLMNEPNNVPAPAWRRVVDAAVAAIRATGARNLVLVPGTDWTGSRNWVEGGNAAAFAGFHDPGDHFAFEMHLYFDGDGSGTSAECVGPDVGVDRVRAATGWLRANRYRGFIGEFGAGPGPTCIAALDRLLAFVSTNRDVWAGWTYWAGGAWWGDYPLNAQPGPDGRPKPQLVALRRYLAPARRSGGVGH